MNRPEFQYKAPKIKTSDLRTPIRFFEYAPSTGPEPGEEEKRVLHECFAEVYNPSMKDMELMNTVGTKQGVSVNIRDTKGGFVPNNDHFAEILDYRYKGVLWNVVDVKSDLQNNAFTKIILGVTQ